VRRGKFSSVLSLTVCEQYSILTATDNPQTVTIRTLKEAAIVSANRAPEGAIYSFAMTGITLLQ
jgi:hypothetical protein